MRSLLVAILVSFASPVMASPEAFIGQKCDQCHSVKVAGVVAKDLSEKAPDLSKVGSKLEKKGIALFLLKKAELEGIKHKKSFSGKTEDLKVISEWLASLK